MKKYEDGEKKYRKIYLNNTKYMYKYVELFHFNHRNCSLAETEEKNEFDFGTCTKTYSDHLLKVNQKKRYYSIFFVKFHDTQVHSR